MKKDELLREIIPLTFNDCFTVFSRLKAKFDFPLHHHDEFEINFIMNANGAQRVVGDHIGEIGEIELVLIGSNLQHTWNTHRCQANDIREVTIQFHKDFFGEGFLKKHQLIHIRQMLESASRGILFSKETASMLSKRILSLNQRMGFDGVLELLSILHDLSVSRNIQLLSDSTFNTNITPLYNSPRIERVMNYMNQNFDKAITLSEVALIANMTETAFSRFFKTHTGANFIDILNDIRLGHASRMLIDSTKCISEIAYNCGFNNISNFNRIFKKKKAYTPSIFRESYSKSAGSRVFI